MEQEVGTDRSLDGGEDGGEAFARQGMDEGGTPEKVTPMEEGGTAEKVTPHQCFSPEPPAPGLSGPLKDAIAASGPHR